ncbi:carbohydrate kinase [Spirochaetia bacterium]|nr:carbohydrate kinase [Spirochaetia bacterium]
MTGDCTLGIDIGTTAIKVVLLCRDGTVQGAWTREHELLTPEPGFAEEDVTVWETNLFALLREAAGQIDSGRIAGIGLTGMVPTLIPLDAAFRPLYHSIQQNDIRAAAIIDELKVRINGDSFFEATGNQINQQHIFPKLIWLKRYRPDVFAAMRYCLGSYDYAGLLLTGKVLIEENWALESGMWHFRERRWLDHILAVAEITRENLAPPVSPVSARGKLTLAAAERSGLPQGIPVYAGTADHVASAFAIGARKSGDLVLKLGGAGDILLATNRGVTDKRLFIDYHCAQDAPFVLNGCTASSGSILKWAKHEFSLPDFNEMDRRAEPIPPGSNGLIMLPYFLGEKTPIFDTDARGVLFGLTLSHSAAHIYRAILEAIAYSFNHHIEVFKDLNLPIRRVFITNGGSKSTLWRSIIADVTGYDLTYVGNNQGSSAGAALLAGIGAGIMDESCALSGEWASVSFMDDNHARYRQGYHLYRQLYESLKPLFLQGKSTVKQAARPVSAKG